MNSKEKTRQTREQIRKEVVKQYRDKFEDLKSRNRTLEQLTVQNQAEVNRLTQENNKLNFELQAAQLMYKQLQEILDLSDAELAQYKLDMHDRIKGSRASRMALAAIGGFKHLAI